MFDYQSIKPMKTAIVGCGAISDIFFQNFTERFRIIDLVKCCSKSGISAQRKAEQYGVQCSTLDEILADPEIELIVNLTPASQHYEIIKAGLLAGKHVYSEKIFTPYLHQTQELMQLASERGLYISGEPDHFLGAAWQCAREYIDAGMLGEVTSIAASSCSNRGGVSERMNFVNEIAGGVAYDFGIYLIASMVALLGPAKEVCGIMRNHVPSRVHRNLNRQDFGQDYQTPNEDQLAASILFESGAIATLHMNGNTLMTTKPYFMIHGTDGSLSMSSPAEFSGDMLLYRAASREPTPLTPAHGFYHDSRGLGAADMAWALRLGRQPRVSTEFVLHCQEIIQGLDESFRTRRFYEMTTTCTRPAPLPKGYLGSHAVFSYDEEGALIF